MISSSVLPRSGTGMSAGSFLAAFQLLIAGSRQQRQGRVGPCQGAAVAAARRSRRSARHSARLLSVVRLGLRDGPSSRPVPGPPRPKSPAASSGSLPIRIGKVSPVFQDRMHHNGTDRAVHPSLAAFSRVQPSQCVDSSARCPMRSDVYDKMRHESGRTAIGAEFAVGCRW